MVTDHDIYVRKIALYERVEALVSKMHYPNMQLCVSLNDEIHVRSLLTVVDVYPPYLTAYTSTMMVLHSTLIESCSDDDLIRLIFEYVIMENMRHEIREQFLYDGKMIYNPHEEEMG